MTVYAIPGVGLAATGKEKEQSTGAGADNYTLTALASAGIVTEPIGPDLSLGVGPVSVSWQLPIGISVTTQLNVEVGGDPPSFVEGYAFAQVDDPFHFVNWQPGMALPLELGWGAGFELRAGLDGAIERETTWGTNIPGFEELLTVKAVSSLAPGGTGQYDDPANFILEVFVTSNPALGIDNDGVRTSILSSLLYTGFGSFAMMNDVTFFNGGFVPPDGTTEFEFHVKDSVYAWLLERQDPSTFEFTRVSDGGEVPEPGTWALMGAGLAGLAWRKRRGTQA
ncbi:MAG: PEP-CTERM sorting domain-containing protein [Bryobacterales bacterium]|nr:PEP-CTERM sorting domain-containing protein [Bryobacterales bacterium]